MTLGGFEVGLVALGLSLSTPVTAQEPGFQDALLDNLAGNWALEGTIRGTQPSPALPEVLFCPSQSSMSRMLPLASAIDVSAAP